MTRVHQFVTFTVHTPSQIAFAEFVRKDPDANDLPAFYQQKRDLFLQLTAGSRFRRCLRGHLLPVVRLLGDLEGERQGRSRIG